MHRAVEQADEADEAFGGTRLANDDRPDGGAASCPRGQNRRGHRFAAYPRCSTDARPMMARDGEAELASGRVGHWLWAECRGSGLRCGTMIHDLRGSLMG